MVAASNIGTQYSFKARGNAEIQLNSGTEELLKFDNRGAGTKVIENFTLGEDTAEFRLDGKYFQGYGDIAYNRYNANKARVSTASDFLDLISAVLSDDGSENSVSFEGNNLVLKIDADNHVRGEYDASKIDPEIRAAGDLRIEFVGVVDQIAESFGLDLSQGHDNIILGTSGDDFLHRGGGIAYHQEKGDDLLIGGGGSDTFQFNSTGAWASRNDGKTPVDHVADLDFSEEDILRFKDWGMDTFGAGTGNGIDITNIDELNALATHLNNDGLGQTSAHVEGDDVFLNVSHSNASLNRYQTVVLHGLGDDLLRAQTQMV